MGLEHALFELLLEPKHGKRMPQGGSKMEFWSTFFWPPQIAPQRGGRCQKASIDPGWRRAGLGLASANDLWGGP